MTGHFTYMCTMETKSLTFMGCEAPFIPGFGNNRFQIVNANLLTNIIIVN